MQGWHALVVERHLAANQDIQDDSKTPHIDLGPSVDLRVEEFWCSEVQRAAERRKMVDGVVQIGETEVDDLDVARVRDEDVLNLQV